MQGTSSKKSASLCSQQIVQNGEQRTSKTFQAFNDEQRWDAQVALSRFLERVVHFYTSASQRQRPENFRKSTKKIVRIQNLNNFFAKSKT